ncbi:unnamed protein product [Closterium sp. Naga37s-1]|nr:unnamed protein product [Closterium sp. Naga37s-1]
MPCCAIPALPEWAPDVSAAQEASQRPSRAASDDDRLFEERLREVRRAPSRAASDDDRLFEERLREVRRAPSRAASDDDRLFEERLREVRRAPSRAASDDDRLFEERLREVRRAPSRATSDDDRLFEERLREVRRQTLCLGLSPPATPLLATPALQAEEKKRAKVVQSTAAIDYDNPQTEPLVDTAALTKDLPTKVRRAVLLQWQGRRMHACSLRGRKGTLRGREAAAREQQGQRSSTAAIDYDNPQTDPLVDTAALTKDLPTKVRRAVVQWHGQRTGEQHGQRMHGQRRCGAVAWSEDACTAGAQEHQGQVSSTAAIDYDNPQTELLVDTAALIEDLPTKIGIGIAATVFAAIFTFEDILPATAPLSYQSFFPLHPSVYPPPPPWRVQIGIGIAATVFAAIFAFGGILPAPSSPPYVTDPL